jgi:hypothetical protein
MVCRNASTPAQQRADVAFSLYDPRHTFASQLLAPGNPLIEVSAWRGHGLRAGGHEITNTTTRVYAHATGESRQAAIHALATLIAGANNARHESVCPTQQNHAGVSSIEAGSSRACGACGSQRPAAERKKVTGK